MKKNCNCRAGAECCPVDGECLTASVVYKAEVTETASSTTSTYIGLAATTFKERYNNHISSFRNPGQKEKTTLSKHVWEMKEKNADFSIRWSLLKKCHAYHPNTGTCNLCLMEKTLILTSSHMNLLNSRNEIMSKCRHRRKFLLSSYLR